MTGHPLLQRIATRLDELAPHCCPPGVAPGLLVGFSGGPDSLVLLLGAHLWATRSKGLVEAAHLHHCLRPTAADEDLEFCRRRCADLHIKLHEFHRDPRSLAKRRGQGLEEAARHLRHTLLRDVVAGSDHLQGLALGHHRDDQAETVLMRLFRGTGLQGMRGILPVQGNILHPLLDIDRKDILACLEDLSESWRVDASNLEGDNLRARLRREVIPVLEGVFGPGAHTRPLRLANLLGADLDLLAGLTRTALATCHSPDRPEALDRDMLLALEPALAGRVLHAWLAAAMALPGSARIPDSPGQVHITTAMNWIRKGQSGSGLDLPGGLRLERSFGNIFLVHTDSPCLVLRHAADYRIMVNRAPLPPDPVALGRRENNGLAVPGGWQLSVPATALSGTLRVGHPQPGDKIRYLGLEGSKKLSDLLQERGVPADLRPGILVVRSETDILWILGIARSEQTRLLPSTDKIVTIHVIERSPDSKRGN